MAAITDELLARIRERAADPARRTDAPPAARGRTVSVGPWSVVGLDLGATLAGTAPFPDADAALAPLATEADLAAVEGATGVTFPLDLRRLYLEVADGGFGPAPGLHPLRAVRDTYLDLTSTPPGRRGQAWPPALIPITTNNPGHHCVDAPSGAVIFWDEEELADGPSDRVWRRSFKPEAADLGAWLEAWVGSPSPEEQQRAMMQNAMLSGLRTTLEYWRARTTEERAAFGLPEVGWEDALFGHLGIDLSQL